jgi:hypothetical protein
MSAKKAHREDAEKEVEFRERKLITLEQLAAASQQSSDTIEGIIVRFVS